MPEKDHKGPFESSGVNLGIFVELAKPLVVAMEFNKEIFQSGGRRNEFDSMR